MLVEEIGWIESEPAGCRIAPLVCVDKPIFRDSSTAHGHLFVWVLLALQPKC